MCCVAAQWASCSGSGGRMCRHELCADRRNAKAFIIVLTSGGHAPQHTLAFSASSNHCLPHIVQQVAAARHGWRGMPHLRSVASHWARPSQR